MRLVQWKRRDGTRAVGVVDESGTQLQVLDRTPRLYDLVLSAHRTATPLAEMVKQRLTTEQVDYETVAAEERLLPPLDHPDPAHCILSGTGLNHLGSAQARDAMHAAHQPNQTDETDSMRMFRLGLEGGKPEPGGVGVQPEWFYKGDGSWIVPPGHPLTVPPFALDGGEEPEVVGLYVIGDHGEVLRVGFALGNEFSDHVMERQNYLYLAHSKLRPSSFGPELCLGPLPESVRGTVRILRDGEPIWSEVFLTGEDNMTHTIANVEHHHFKYEAFRRPGDVHCHFFGTATLSFAAGVQAQTDDIFEISAEGFGRPLRNPLLVHEETEQLVTITVL